MRSRISVKSYDEDLQRSCRAATTTQHYQLSTITERRERLLLADSDRPQSTSRHVSAHMSVRVNVLLRIAPLLQRVRRVRQLVPAWSSTTGTQMKKWLKNQPRTQQTARRQLWWTLSASWRRFDVSQRKLQSVCPSRPHPQTACIQGGPEILNHFRIINKSY